MELKKRRNAEKIPYQLRQSLHMKELTSMIKLEDRGSREEENLYVAHGKKKINATMASILRRIYGSFDCRHGEFKKN